MLHLKTLMHGPHKAREHLAYDNGVYRAKKTSYHYQFD